MFLMKYFYLLVVFLLFNKTVKAQESLSGDISYAYVEKLVETAKKNYPKFKMYDARMEAGGFVVKKAKLSYFEIFSFSYLFSPDRLVVGSPSALNGYQLGFFVNIGSLLQKPSLIKQAKSELQALQFDRDSYELNLEAEVKRRYYTYIQYLALLKVKSEALQDVESLQEEMKFRYEKGERSLDEYTKALVAVSDRQQSMISAEVDILISKASLEELLGQKLENIK